MKRLIISWRRALWPIVLLLLLGIAPLLAGENRFLAFVIGIVLLNLLWTAGMNLLYGYTGLVPLVFAGIAGISAYGTAALVMKAGWSFWLAMPAAALPAAIVGVVLCLPALRLKGFYFILSSLVIQTVVSLAFVYFVGLTNGDVGISRIPPPDTLVGGGVIRGSAVEIMLGVFAWAGIIGIAVIAASPFGTRLIAVREDDLLATAIGIDVVRCKLLSFFVTSLYAAIGGSLYTTYIGFISPRSFDVLVSLNVWLMVAFGGRGTIMGPIVGTVALTPVQYLLQDYDTLKDVIYGLLIVVITIAMPTGIYGAIKRRLPGPNETVDIKTLAERAGINR
jgi:branched-chain amino acid transport system permease protein